MKKYLEATLDQLSKDAKASPRKRSHLNIHEDLNDPIQRLLIALEPETYICPHFHPEKEKKELIHLIKGKCACFTFEQDGTVIDTQIINPLNPIIEFPPLTWHSIICLEEGTIISEVKSGPYIPLDDKCFATWAPREGDDNVQTYLNSLKQLING
ncbi:MAG: WbuC family cupin fold metalloprotein [Lentisphaeraceae bacterium]|nr:WbuC family cupin fold metalloprotein [Lentisphaeraceae bacterium]